LPDLHGLPCQFIALESHIRVRPEIQVQQWLAPAALPGGSIREYNGYGVYQLRRLL